MKQFYLTEIVTKDKLIHQGIFCKPTKKPSFAKASAGKAILWVHGLSGKFYGDVAIMERFADQCEKHGWGFASFNNRGHDLISSTTKIDSSQPSGYTQINGGAGYEKFKECVFDIHAGVDFLVTQGFSQVFLVGHSTGAIKVGYSEGTQPHKNVAGIILAGALSDRLGPDVDYDRLDEQVRDMEERVASGKGDELIEGLSFFPMSAKRFISLNKKGSAEEVFDYGESDPQMKTLKKITKPLFIIVSEKDEYLDRAAVDVTRVFDEHAKSSHYKSMIFPDANHGFEGKEGAFVKAVCNWIAGL